MAAFIISLVLLLAMAANSDATYCVCNSGVDEHTLQKNIDYACGALADCTAIHENGACYNPNTVRDHCNYAVNSYYQRARQINGSCDFQGTAIIITTPPSAASGCVYQASPSTGGSTSPGTPNTGGTGGTNPGTLPGSTSSGFGLGPTGSGLGGPDNNASSPMRLRQCATFISFFLTIAISSLMWPNK